MIDLAARAVACPAWRWMAGMSGSALHFGERHGFVVLGVSVDDESSMIDVFIHGHSHGIYLTEADYEQDGRQVDSGNDALPDLTSPATRGCLLELVREAWGDASIVATPSYMGWTVAGRRVACASFGLKSEAEALVGALVHAPIAPDVAPEQSGA